MSADRAAADYRHRRRDGLVQRWSSAEDAEPIGQLLSNVFRRQDDPPNLRIADSVRRRMSGETGLMGAGDFALVEDASSHGSPVVACACLLRQEWAYEGIPFRIGRPEAVGTDANYRNRGLVRALLDMLHARSAAEGHLAQAIIGIPYFYRQFGYEYALDLGGRRATHLSLIPKAKEGVPEPYALRLATLEDLPRIMAIYDRRSSGGIVRTLVPESQWRYRIALWRDVEASGGDIANLGLPDPMQAIVDAAGVARGFALLEAWRRGRELQVYALEMDPEVSLAAAMPSLLRALQAYGQRIPAIRPDAEPFSEIGFRLGRAHPVYDVLGRALASVQEPPYAWYVRVPDVVAFLRYVAPALERRLVASVAAGHTGELRLNLYRGGVRLAFEAGKLVAVEPWREAPYGSWGDAGLPPLVFLQLLFGYRGLDELRRIYPDVWASPEGEPLINALFPARPSWVLPL